MVNNHLLFDITDVDIDISLNRAERIYCLLGNIERANYTKKVKVNDTIIFTNFLSAEKLSRKAIMKILG